MFQCPGQCKEFHRAFNQKTLIACLLSRPYFRLWDIVVNNKIEKIFSLMKLTGRADFKKISKICGMSDG